MQFLYSTSGRFLHPMRHSSSSRFLLLIAFIIPSFHLFCGCPLFRLLFSIQLYVFFGNLLSSILMVWPYQINCLDSIVSDMPILYLISSLEIQWFKVTPLQKPVSTEFILLFNSSFTVHIFAPYVTQLSISELVE